MEPTVLNFFELAKKLNVEEREIIMPGGRKAMDPIWRKKDIQALAEMMAREYAGTAEQFRIEGHAAANVTAAAICALAPCTFINPVPQDGIDVIIEEKPTGEPNPAAGISFDITVEGDDLFMDVAIEDFARPDNKPYDMTLIPQWVLPVVPADKNVYIKGAGLNAMCGQFAITYVGKCKSLWFAAHDPEYVCCWTAAADKEIGDAKPFVN